MEKRRIIAISDLHIGQGPRASALAANPGADQPVNRMHPPMLGHPEKLTDFLTQLAAFAEKSSDTRLELVIHGDFIDFLAEPAIPAPGGDGDTGVFYEPWTASEEDALKKLDRVLAAYGHASSGQLFFALRQCVQRVQYTTILLGNHDVELTYPRLRTRLLEVLGVGSEKCGFLLHNEPYRAGSVLIEHGDRYDNWNAIDRAGLRAIAARVARGEKPDRVNYIICPGSKLVAYVMNYIKEDLRFVDLLKPDELISMELLRQIYPRMIEWLQIVIQRLDVASFYLSESLRPHLPRQMWRMDDTADLTLRLSSDDSHQLSTRLLEALPRVYRRAEAAVLSQLYRLNPTQAETGRRQSIGAAEVRARLRACLDDSRSLHRRLRGNQPISDAEYETLRMLLDAKRMTRPEPQHLAAKRMLDHTPLGLKLVIMGHTHAARSEPHGDGTYVNTGTWADLLDVNESPWLLSDLGTFKQVFNDILQNQFPFNSSPYFADASINESGDPSPAPGCDSFLRRYDEHGKLFS